MSALSGIRVLELGSLEAAAYCGKLFADFGAEVVKVEPPEGDPVRKVPPLVDAGGGNMQSGVFAWLNTNKQGVVVDEAKAGDRALLDALADRVDVLIDARPGPGPAAWREAVRARRPDLTVMAMNWFGEDGPYAHFTPTDAVCRALAGIIFTAGTAEGPPELLNDHQASIVGGLAAFSAAVAGQISEDKGRDFEVSLFEANLMISEYYSLTARAPGFVEARLGRSRFFPTFPLGVYPCKEGWLGFNLLSPDQWRGGCEVLDMLEQWADPRFQFPVGRLACADELEAVFKPKLLEKTAEEWFDLALKRRLPWAICPSMEDLLKQKVHRERGAFAPVTIGEASFEGPIPPHRLLQTPPAAGGAAPLLGQHTDAVRAGLAASPKAEPRPRPAGDPKRPLAGVRVIDLTMGWAGTSGTRQVADLGADVVKVESIGYADWWRGGAATEEGVRERQYERAQIFNGVNRNKRGITLDLQVPEGANLLKRLVAGADAVIENYSQGVLPKMGLGYQDLKAVKPNIVMVSMPAFPGDSEWAEARAYGSTLEQGSGLPMVTGWPDDPPLHNHLAYGDPVGGLSACASLIVAVAALRRTGVGQHVDMSQVQALFPFAAPWIVEQSITGGVRRYGNRHPTQVPHGVFPGRNPDTWVLIAADGDDQWRALCHAIGRKDLAEDPALATLEGRRAQEDRLEQELTAWTTTVTAGEAMMRLQEAGVAAGEVKRASALYEDVHLNARGVWGWTDRPYIGIHPQCLVPFRENGAPYPVIRPAPLLGEYNTAVLGGELGLSDAELARLTETQVIGEELLTMAARRPRSAAALRQG
jgi:crotonobetainyl-CoA:carnitine CoA-transferase CaiB-like acyl-CoA transferase